MRNTSENTEYLEKEKAKKEGSAKQLSLLYMTRLKLGTLIMIQGRNEFTDL